MLVLIASGIMTRTTLDLDPSVLRQLRLRSRRERKSMGQVASEVLAGALAEPETLVAPTFQWTAADLGEPRVDLEDKEAVRAILDERS